MRMLITVGVVLTCMLFGTVEVVAFEHYHCLDRNLRWSGNSKTLRASPVSFPDGDWRHALQDAVDRLNDNPSNFNYGLTTDTGGVSLGNDSSEVWGSTDSSVLQGAPAIAYTYWTCYWYWWFGTHEVVHVDEVDIAFDYDDTPASDWRWTTSDNKSNLMRYGGDYRSIQGTALHEMGHGLILLHENSEYNIMGKDYEHIHVNGSTARAYFGEDACDGMVHLYGTRSPHREDVGVVHWKYYGASGEYSDHEKTKLYDMADAVLPHITVDYDGDGDGDERHYRVSPGQTVKVEFTYENNGANRQNPVSVGFYISTNSTISTWDTPVGSASLDLGRNSVYTAKHTITIPTSLISGQNYWIGAVIDDSGDISERVGWNNATYIPIRID